MCAISGILDQRKSSAELSLLIDQMSLSQSHRGPDGAGVWMDSGVAFGHRRLKLVDLSDHASQPMLNREKTQVIVFNGEIYNHQEIRRELSHVSWQSSSDTEVLLRAFEKWGPECLERLNGMFAFAIWDVKKRKLFAARDRFGIKPFYYQMLPDGGLAFASEIKGLRTLAATHEVDLVKVGEFLRWGALDFDDKTWFKGIRSLPAGHWMTWQDSQCQLGRYYAIEDQIDEALELNHAEVVDRFENLLRDSIKLQSLCDRKVGVHLSGGVDSSIVAALARDEISAPLDSYTFAYDEEKYSELPFASDVARHLKIGNQASFLRSADVETWLPRALIAEDEPFTSFRQLSHHKLYADFAQSGSTVVLEASGGDEIGAGYSSYLWSNFLDQAQTGSVTGAAANFSSSLASMGLSEGQRETFLFGSALNYQMPGMCTSDGMPYLDPEVLSGDFFETSTRFRPEYQRPFKSALRNQQYMDLVYAKLPRGLRYIERASSAVGREARLPLLDHRIVELGFQASNQSKIIPGTLRRFMKDASSQLLPESVIAKNKRSVADPQRDWLRGDLKSMVHETLASRPFRERGIFNAPRAIQSFDRFCKGDPSLNSLGIFQMFIVEHWFRNFWR